MIDVAPSPPADERSPSDQRRRLLWLVAATAAVLWLARDVLAPFVVAAIIAYAFSPLVAAVQQRTRLPRLGVVAILYAIALAAVAIAAVAVAGRLVSELEELATGGAAALADTLRGMLGHDAIEIGTRRISVTEIAGQLNGAVAQLLSTPGDALHLAGLVGDLALQSVLTLIVTFYLLLDGERFWAFALRFLRPGQRDRAGQLAGRIHLVLGGWLRGQLALIVLVALVLYVVLGPVLHLPYALALSLLSGVLEIIPLVGPIIAAALAGVIAFSHGGTSLAVLVLGVYVVVREVEDQLVMPIVIGRAVHLHPVVTIFAVLVGLSAWGILGGLLAVPVAAALNVTLTELLPPESTSAQVPVPTDDSTDLAATVPPAAAPPGGTDLPGMR